MGTSHTRKAGDRLRAISDFCYAQTRTTNAYEVKGVRYFVEWSYREFADGHITGQIWKDTRQKSPSGNNLYSRAGRIKIEGDGTIRIGPAVLKNVPCYVVYIDNIYHGNLDYGKQPNTDTLWEEVKVFAKSLEPGGANDHISKARGYVPYPNTAKLVDGATQETVAEWKAGTFQVWNTAEVAATA